jgi:hypothetical protein
MDARPRLLLKGALQGVVLVEIGRSARRLEAFWDDSGKILRIACREPSATSRGRAMPVHDWTRVSAGIFHDFHCSWIIALKDALNNRVLPPDHYALAEQITGELGPDVLTLEAIAPAGGGVAEGTSAATAVAVAPPRVLYTATTRIDAYVLKQRSLVIRHSSDDRVVAIIEVLSPGNKSSRHALRAVVDTAAAFLVRGYHLLLLDLLPPTSRDPNGIHGAVWEEIGDAPYLAPPGKCLTLASYASDTITKAYVEPVGVGDTLPEMPLFLDPESYVSVPLEPTYQIAWSTVPRRWRTVLEATP